MPPLDLDSRFMVCSSLRKAFFSDEDMLDLSMFLISLILTTKALEFADPDAVVFTIPGLLALPAKEVIGINVSDRHAVIKTSVIFFILFYFRLIYFPE